MRHRFRVNNIMRRHIYTQPFTHAHVHVQSDMHVLIHTYTHTHPRVPNIYDRPTCSVRQITTQTVNHVSLKRERERKMMIAV